MLDRAEKKPLTAAQESDIFLLSQDKYITFDGGVFHEKESPVLGGAGVRGLYAPVHWGQPAVFDLLEDVKEMRKDA